MTGRTAPHITIPILTRHFRSHRSTTMSTEYPSVRPGTEAVTLNTGAKMPLLGFGTWRAPDEQVTKAVEAALRNGVCHIDCAWAYDNEEAVGRGIKASGVPREQLFVTTKLWCTYHRRVEQGLDSSLKRLGLDYVDLFLMHWPIPLKARGEEKVPMTEEGKRDIDFDRKIGQTWAEMEAVLSTGKARAIGVSNVSEAMMEELLQTAKVTPAANQIESHPFLPEHELVTYLQAKGIAAEAYSPLGSGAAPVLQDETIVRIAKAKGVDAAQVVIGWQAQRGVAVLPKSVTESRIVSNSKLITLTDEEMHAINELYLQPGKQVRTCMPPVRVCYQDDRSYNLG